MAKLVLFDFDGTIADSSEGIFYTSGETMRRLGLYRKIPLEQHRKFIGPPLKESFRIAYGLDERYLDDAVRIYREIYREKGDKMLAPYKGIKEAIERLRSLGYKTGVATNKSLPVVRRCLENIKMTHYFDVVSGPLEGESANKSEIIKRASQELGIAIEETIMIGDTENDRLGSEMAGSAFIAALWGFGYTLEDQARLPFSSISPSDIVNSILEKESKMISKVVSDNAPKAIGPYSQAVKFSNLLFISGQIPLDPQSGELVGKTGAEQAKQCFKNIKAVLKEAGTDISRVVKVTVFLKSIGDFQSVNEVYSKEFEGVEILPARSAIEVAALPKGALVEIEVIAAL